MHDPLDSEKPPVKRAQTITLPAVPVVVANAASAAVMMPDGELKILSHEQARMMVHKQPVMVAHAPFTRSRLGANDLIAFDVLELFSFVHPAKFCVPTPHGLAKFLGLNPPSDFEDYPFALMECAQAILSDLTTMTPSENFSVPSSPGAMDFSATTNTPSAHPNQPAADSATGANQPGATSRKLDLIRLAEAMGLNGKGWLWTPFVIQALGQTYDPARPIETKTTMNVWRTLPAWSETAPPPPPSHNPVTGDETRERLRLLLASGPQKTEPRPQQIEFATRMAAAFNPADTSEQPHVVLAEAGTGVGKTLGYLAPASVWAEKNDGTVWVSTYTKNLQRQIDQELNRLYPNPDLKSHKVAIRKGRENYLCLLNLEDMVAGAALAKNPSQIVAAGLMARWTEATREGDLSGADFPGWLTGLLGVSHSVGLADRRGECIYSACDHYHKCFVERAVRKSRHASIVVANHALVMIQTALAGPDQDLPQRYVFDEGHHLFEAADGAFSAHLSAWETADLRRWVLGPEGGRRSRARGLKKRAEDLVSGNDEALALLDDILQAAQVLPAQGWSRRLRDRNPHGATEEFLGLVYQCVHARADGRDGPYSLEVETHPVQPELAKAASALKAKLRGIQKPMLKLAVLLRKKLTDQADTLDSDTRKRLDAVSSTLIRKAETLIGGWADMLDRLEQPTPDPHFIDWMEIERSDGQASDVGLHRHWLDPMSAFAGSIKTQAHGIAITSATLRDQTGNDDADWRSAMNRTGVSFLSDSPQRLSVPSPFDYAASTRAFIITDVRKDDMAQVASAYRALFTAANGGALGLFTAISRLRAVYQAIHLDLEQSGLPLYAQHVDDIDTGTLVDIFREDRNACLFGTDAVRDGVDVPGDTLRLLVYDRVPWPRPTILHKARRQEFGGRHYDEMVTRMRLRQAFGRLVRRADDRGVFVMLDNALPSRLHSAFPDGVQVERIGLAEAVKAIGSFLEQ